MKSRKNAVALRAYLSLPSWERGLKFANTDNIRRFFSSLPSWERGLKFKLNIIHPRRNVVAPFVGAWIEMNVAETIRSFLHVAPFVGAWIEISHDSRCSQWKSSLPSWERGLKFLSYHKRTDHRPSLPSWERGLKSGILIPQIPVSIVAPFVGAWIEISGLKLVSSKQCVAPFVGAWIEIP